MAGSLEVPLPNRTTSIRSWSIFQPATLDAISLFTTCFLHPRWWSPHVWTINSMLVLGGGIDCWKVWSFYLKYLNLRCTCNSTCSFPKKTRIFALNCVFVEFVFTGNDKVGWQTGRQKLSTSLCRVLGEHLNYEHHKNSIPCPSLSIKVCPKEGTTPTFLFIFFSDGIGTNPRRGLDS